MMAEAKSRLDEARQSYKSINRRDGLIGDFRVGIRDYRSSKKDVERHTILLRWILGQVPLVEAELKESEAAETGPDATHGTKRRLGRDEKVSTDRIPKRQRWSDQAMPSSGTTLQVKEKSGCGLHKDRVDDVPPPKGARFDNRSSNPRQDEHSGANQPPTKRTVLKSKVSNKHSLRSIRAPQPVVIP